MKGKDFNPIDYLTNTITDTFDPGYVDPNLLDISAILSKNPINQLHLRKKIVEKVQKRYNKEVNMRRAQHEMRVQIEAIASKVRDIEHHSEVQTFEFDQCEAKIDTSVK